MADTIAFKSGRDEVVVSVDNPLPTGLGTDYESVAASQTTQVMGVAGAIGDTIAGITIIPTAPNPGAVTIKDGGFSAITIFAGGITSVQNLVPFHLSLNIRSTTGAWMVTTGANVTALVEGNFT